MTLRVRSTTRAVAVTPAEADTVVGDAAQALVEGSLLGAYRFNSYKRDGGDNDKPEIVAMTVLEADAEKLAAVSEGVRAGQIVGEQANWARDLVNELSLIHI